MEHVRSRRARVRAQAQAVADDATQREVARLEVDPGAAEVARLVGRERLRGRDRLEERGGEEVQRDHFFLGLGAGDASAVQRGGGVALSQPSDEDVLAALHRHTRHSLHRLRGVAVGAAGDLLARRGADHPHRGALLVQRTAHGAGLAGRRDGEAFEGDRGGVEREVLRRDPAGRHLDVAHPLLGVAEVAGPQGPHPGGDVGDEVPAVDAGHGGLPEAHHRDPGADQGSATLAVHHAAGDAPGVAGALATGQLGRSVHRHVLRAAGDGEDDGEECGGENEETEPHGAARGGPSGTLIHVGLPHLGFVSAPAAGGCSPAGDRRNLSGSCHALREVPSRSCHDGTSVRKR